MKFIQWLLNLLTKSTDPNKPPEVVVTVPITPTGYTTPVGSTIRKIDVKLTEHFSLVDLTTTDHTELQSANRDLTDQQVQKLTLVAELLETVREIIGMPIIVDDGMRCSALNKIDGGVSDSQHALAEAADWVPEGADKKAVRAINDLYPIFQKVWDAAKAGRFKHGQMIFEEKADGTAWVHLSLGMPYRDVSKCGEILILRGGNYEMLDQIKYS